MVSYSQLVIVVTVILSCRINKDLGRFDSAEQRTNPDDRLFGRVEIIEACCTMTILLLPETQD